MDHSREGRRERKGSCQDDSGNEPAGFRYGERDGTVRDVSEPENERNERTNS